MQITHVLDILIITLPGTISNLPWPPKHYIPGSDVEPEVMQKRLEAEGSSSKTLKISWLLAFKLSCIDLMLVTNKKNPS